jgi:hypothetical protein
MNNRMNLCRHLCPSTISLSFQKAVDLVEFAPKRPIACEGQKATIQKQEWRKLWLFSMLSTRDLAEMIFAIANGNDCVWRIGKFRSRALRG